LNHDPVATAPGSDTRQQSANSAKCKQPGPTVQEFSSSVRLLSSWLRLSLLLVKQAILSSDIVTELIDNVAELINFAMDLTDTAAESRQSVADSYDIASD
jgi:hypothetical protein